MNWQRAKWLWICIGLTGLALGVSGQGAEKTPYWYASDGRINLTEVRNYVTLRFVEGTTEAAVRNLVRQETVIAPFEEGWWIPSRRLLAARLKTQQTPEALTTLKDRLLDRPEVEVVFPVYSMQEPHIVLLTDDICVQFRPEIAPAEIDALNKRYGVRIVKTMGFGPKAYVLRVNDPAATSALDVANAYQESGRVLFAHPDFIAKKQYFFTPNDPLYPDQWHLDSTGQGGALINADVNAPEAWDFTRGTRSITIGVYDDAIEIGHEDFRAPDKIAPSWDFGGGDADPSPTPGAGEAHGTSVSGVATAVGDNALGVSGAAPECKLMGLKWGASTSDDAAAFTWVKDNGGDVMNNSWGYIGITSIPPAVKAAIDDLTDNGRGGLGAVVFFAAGNGDQPVSIDNIMAAYDRCIAVAASTDQDLRAFYSAYGPEVDICAPSNGGVTTGITTTDVMGSDGYASGNYNNDFGGTSSASPLACGVGALVLSANPSLSRLQVQDILQRTAIKIDPAGGNYDPNGHSDLYGYGKVDAFAAVREAQRLLRTPKNLQVSINNDDSFTDVADVTLGLSGTNLDSTAQVRFLNAVGKVDLQNRPSLSDPRWSPWMPFQATVDWTLLLPQDVNGQPTEGLTSVYFNARNSVGASWEVAGDDIFINYPPLLESAVGLDDTHVELTFDQLMDKTTAETPGNYTIALTTPDPTAPPVNVTAAALSPDLRRVRLTTSSQSLREYQVQVAGVKDTNATEITADDRNNDGQPDNEATFRALWVVPQPGWPQGTEGLIFAPPTLADVTGDGRLDVLLAAQGGQVYVWDGVTSQVAPGWPQTAGSGLQTSPVVGDVDNDGQPEIVVAAANQRVYAWNAEGSRVSGWPQTVEAVPGLGPTLADVDGDGVLEVLLGTRDGRVYAWEGDGDLLPNWPVRAGGGVLACLASGPLYDAPGLTDDGAMEVVVGAADGKVYAWQGNGQPVPGWPVSVGVPLGLASPVLVDVDGDRALDVVLGTPNGNLYACQGNGQPVSTWGANGVVNGGARGYSTGTVLDTNGDGSADQILFGTDTQSVVGFDLPGGTLAKGYPKDVGSPQLRGSPILGEVWPDRPGLEVLVGTAEGQVRAWNAQTGENVPGWGGVPGWESSVRVESVLQPLLAYGDTDGDGRGEVVAAAEQAYMWDAGPGTVPLNPLAAPWVMFAHDSRHSGAFGAVPVWQDGIGPWLTQAEARASRKVEATFSEWVRQDDAENKANYQVVLKSDPTQNLGVEAVEWLGDGQTVSLTTQDPQSQNVEYEVVAQGVRDLQDNLVLGGQVRVTFRGRDTDAPIWVNLEAVSATQLRLWFNEALDRATAEVEGHYTITPELTVVKAEYQVVSEGATPQYVVDLTTGVQQEGVSYRLRVAPEVTDAAGNRLGGVNEQGFVGIESRPPQVIGAAATASDRVEVTFNEAVSKATAEAPGNYQVSPTLTVVSAELLADEPTVRLQTSLQSRGVDYTVTVNGVEDLHHNEVGGNNAARFVGIDTLPPRLDDAVAKTIQQVEVTFNEAVEKASAETVGNYQITQEGTGQVLNVAQATLQADARKVLLDTGTQQEDARYQLVVGNVRDESGNSIVPGQGDSDVFTAPSVNPVVVQARAIASDQVEVEFNKEVTPASAEVVMNYTLVPVGNPTQTIGITQATLQLGGRKVRLQTSGALGEGVAYRLTVTGVKDQQGNDLAVGRNEYVFTTDRVAPWVESVERVSDEEVEVTFSEAMDPDSVEGPGNYLFTPPLEVKAAQVVGAGVPASPGERVLLRTAQQPESTTYTVRVRNVRDAAGVPIVPGDRDTGSFRTPDVKPRLEGVRRIDDQHVELDFSEPLQQAGAENKANYTIQRSDQQGTLTVQEATLSEDGLLVQLLTSPQAEDADYLATVLGVADLAGNEIDGTHNIAYFSTPRVLPSPPSNVQAAATEGGILVSWRSNVEPDVIGYLVYRAEAATGPFDLITQGNPVPPSGAPRYEDTTGTPAGRYWYKVAAIDSLTPSVWRQSDAVAVVFPDGEAPQIAHAQPPGAALQQPLEVTATVTDNGQVAQVMLFYRTIGQATFQLVKMTRQVGTDDYKAAIPAELVTGEGVEYYIQATDTAQPPNTSTNPAVGRGPQFFVVPIYARLAGRVLDPTSHGVDKVTVTARWSGGTQPKTTTDDQGNYQFVDLPPGEYEIVTEKAGYLTTRQSLTLGAGEDATGRNVTVIEAPTIYTPLSLVSVPLTFDTPPLAGNVFGNATFTVSAWDPVTEEYVTYPEQAVRVEPGQGYFIKTTQGTPKVVAEAPVSDPDQSVKVNVGEGWNLIGNPFPFAVPLANVWVKLPGQSDAQAVDFATAAQRDWVKDFLWGYGPGGYQLVSNIPELGALSQLKVWNGYWLRADRPLILVIYGSRIVPLEQDQPAPSRARASADGTMAIRLIATVAGVTDSFNFVGVAGSRRPDGLQIPSPPPVAPFIDLVILDPQGRAQAVDLRPRVGAGLRASPSEWIYDLAVETDQVGKEVAVTWPDLTALPAGYTATLTDLESGQTRSMRTTTHYTFTASRDGVPRRFRMVIRRSAGPGLTISGFTAVTHKAAGSTSLAYTLSAPAEVTLVVRTLAGQVVATVAQRVAQPGGLNQITWDGRDAQGRRVPPGTYLCELVGVPETGDPVQVVRTIGQ